MSDAAVVPIDRAARGISLLGVIPLDGGVLPEWDPADARLAVRLVAYQDVAAIVCTAPPAGGDADPLHVTARHWEVHRALLHGDVVPAPPSSGTTPSSEIPRAVRAASIGSTSGSVIQRRDRRAAARTGRAAGGRWSPRGRRRR